MLLYAHHMLLRLWRAPLVPIISSLLVIVVIVGTAFVLEILRPFVFMCAAKVLEPMNDLFNIVRRIFIGFLIVPKDDHRDVDLT